MASTSTKQPHLYFKSFTFDDDNDTKEREKRVGERQSL